MAPASRFRDSDGRVPSVAAPFVGRDFELELLENTLGRVIRDKRAHLFTIYGEPGVGKSRLAREFLEGVEGATILVGRSLPYGEGVTYWPLAEMVKVAAGIADDDPVQEAIAKLRAHCGDDAVADLLALAVGVLEGIETERSQQEIAWAAREWAAELADAQPLILVFEDVHWAEEPLLELIEHLAERVKDAPLLILCLARPELLDIRPAGAAAASARPRSSSSRSRPEESEELLDALLADRELSPSERKTLLEKTEGNPLFVEETTRMLLEGGTAAKRIPDTLQAMIAARIDRLPPEREAAAPARRRDRPHLLGGRGRAADARGRGPRAGARRPAPARLRHAREPLVDLRRARLPLQARAHPRRRLRGLAKAARAELHQQVADWLHEVAGEELVEIRAYHLDHAATLLEELDGAAPAGARHARRRGAREGRPPRARARGEPGGAAPARARGRARADAPAPLPRRPRRLAARRPAGAGGRDGARLRRRDRGRRRPAPGPRADRARRDRAPARRRPAARPRARRAGARPARGREARGPVSRRSRCARGSAGGSATSTTTSAGSRKALEVAREIGRKDLEASAADELASSAIARLDLDRGRRLVAEALELAEESGNITALGWALVSQARIDALRGRLDEAAAGLDAGRGALLRSPATQWALARVNNHFGWVERRRGDLAAAERRFRDAIRILKPLEDRGTLCESQRGLAQVLVSLKKIDEAERYALEARETVGPHDTISRATTRMALGLVRAAQGRDEEAEALLREAVAVVDGKPLLLIRRELVTALARFLRERGRIDEAEEYEAELADYEAALAPRLSLEHGLDRLRRRLVGRLRDHGRRPLEARERVAQRLGAERPLAVGQVLRLVAVRVGDVGEVDVERRAGLEHGVGASSTAANASTSVKAPSEVACMCAKSITGRTQRGAHAISSTSSIEPSSLTRPITSTPNGTARPFARAARAASRASATTSSSVCSRRRGRARSRGG